MGTYVNATLTTAGVSAAKQGRALVVLEGHTTAVMITASEPSQNKITIHATSWMHNRVTAASLELKDAIEPERVLAFIDQQFVLAPLLVSTEINSSITLCAFFQLFNEMINLDVKVNIIVNNSEGKKVNDVWVRDLKHVHSIVSDVLGHNPSGTIAVHLTIEKRV